MARVCDKNQLESFGYNYHDDGDQIVKPNISKNQKKKVPPKHKTRKRWRQ